jgi:transcriptional regulator with XRE-family HTH domain
MQAIGDRVKRFRCAGGLSQAQLAKHAGVDAMVVSRLESGTKPRLALESGVRLAHVLGLTMDQFCGLAAAPDPGPALKKTLPPLERPDTLTDAPCEHWESRRVLAACVLAWQERGYTQRQITDSLNAWGIKAPNRKGYWQPSNLFSRLWSDIPRAKKRQRELIRTYGPQGTRFRPPQASPFEGQMS